MFNKDNCKCYYEEVGRQFNNSQLTRLSGTGFTSEEYQYLLYGRTNIELRCKKCGNIKVISTAGKVGIHD